MTLRSEPDPILRQQPITRQDAGSAQPLIVQQPDAPQAEATPQPSPIFQQRWWLESASQGRIETVTVRWDAVTVGRLDFYRSRRFGFVTLGMPPYTRTLGPVLTLPESGPATRLLNTGRVVNALVAALPPHHSFFQLLDPGDATPFAFVMAGYAATQQFTFRVPAGADPAQLWKDLASSTRRLIKQAQDGLAVERHMDLDRYLALTGSDHAPATSTHDFAILRDLFDQARQRGCVRILSAVGAGGVDAASVILVWDDHVLYYWLPQRDKRQSCSGANALLIWHAMKLAFERSLLFDFDGYNSVGTARFLASFGVPPVVRPAISHDTNFGILRTALRRHPRLNGTRPDPTIKTSFRNARLPK